MSATVATEPKSKAPTRAPGRPPCSSAAMARLNCDASSGLPLRHAQTLSPKWLSKAFSPVRIARSRLAYAEWISGRPCRIAGSRIEPGASARSSSPTGVSVNRRLAVLFEHAGSGEEAKQSIQGDRVSSQGRGEVVRPARAGGQRVGDPQGRRDRDRLGDPVAEQQLREPGRGCRRGHRAPESVRSGRCSCVMAEAVAGDHRRGPAVVGGELGIRQSRSGASESGGTSPSWP